MDDLWIRYHDSCHFSDSYVVQLKATLGNNYA